MRQRLIWGIIWGALVCVRGEVVAAAGCEGNCPQKSQTPPSCDKTCGELLTGCVVIDGECGKDFQDCRKACEKVKKENE